MPEVKEAFLKVLRENYPNHSEGEYLEKYQKIAKGTRITNILVEKINASRVRQSEFICNSCSNVNVFRPNDGMIGIIPEEKNKYDDLKALSERVKIIIKRKKEETNQYGKMQEQFVKMQEQFVISQKEIDKELAELEDRIDKLTSGLDAEELTSGIRRRGGKK